MTVEIAARVSEVVVVERGSSLFRDARRRLVKNRAAVASAVILGVIFALCLVVPEVCKYRYDVTDLSVGSRPPSFEHWMGTDDHGRDMLARVFFGGRVSFAVGVIATLMIFAIGVTWGGVAGYFGGKIDAWLMRFVDLLYTFPLLILVILLRRPSSSNERTSALSARFGRARARRACTPRIRRIFPSSRSRSCSSRSAPSRG